MPTSPLPISASSLPANTASAPRHRCVGRSLSPSPLIPRSLSPFASECISFFAETVQIFGVPKSVGQIYGLLYASPEPLSFSDIVVQLEISKGSASQGLQLLRSLGAIRVAAARFAPGIGDRRLKVSGLKCKDGPSALAPHPLPGDVDASRRVAYEPELSLRKLVSGVLHERVTPLSAAGADRLKRLRELAERDGGE